MQRLPIHPTALAAGVGCVVACSVMAIGPASAALEASKPSLIASAKVSTVTSCNPWFPVTKMHYTSNHLLGEYLQARACTGYLYEYRLAVHNFSPNGVGSRAYGIQVCAGGRVTQWRGVYIGSGDTWASPPVEVSLYDSANGLTYRAHEPDGAPEVQTGCARP